jgi:hypothetical protein
MAYGLVSFGSALCGWSTMCRTIICTTVVKKLERPELRKRPKLPFLREQSWVEEARQRHAFAAGRLGKWPVFRYGTRRRYELRRGHSAIAQAPRWMTPCARVGS